MPTAKLSSKSQVVIPADIRRQLGLRPGDRLCIDVQGESIILRKLPKSANEGLDQFCSEIFEGYAEQLLRDRDEWDR